jgi:hypothetical protein
MTSYNVASNICQAQRSKECKLMIGVAMERCNYGVFSCTPNGGRQFLSNRRSNPILYHCVGNLTVYLLENSNLSCVDRHSGYMKKKLRRTCRWLEGITWRAMSTRPYPVAPFDWLSSAVVQGLTLVHFSAQPEQFLPRNTL